MGIEHRLTRPLWPRANGEVERHNRTLLKAMRVSHTEKNYRSPAHTTTGKCPEELLAWITGASSLWRIRGHRISRDCDAERKQFSIDYVDNKSQAREKCIQKSDNVVLEKRRENKLSPCCEREPYRITARYGDQVQLNSSQGAGHNRNIQHVKRFFAPVAKPSEPHPSSPVVVPSGPAPAPAPAGERENSHIQETTEDENWKPESHPSRGIAEEIRKSYSTSRETGWLCYHLIPDSGSDTAVTVITAITAFTYVFYLRFGTFLLCLCYLCGAL